MEDKKRRLYASAKELFSRKGFKDTNVSDITKEAGMAVGTFYNYYASKEKLFMDIFLDENIKLKKSMVAVVDMDQEPLNVARQMMVLNMQGMQENPILKEWYNKSVFDKIEQLYREENGIEAVDFMYDTFLHLVEKWQAEGKMRKDLSSKMIMAIFAAIINIDTHKDEIGLEYFPELMETITELVFKGLCDYD